MKNFAFSLRDAFIFVVCPASIFSGLAPLFGFFFGSGVLQEALDELDLGVLGVVGEHGVERPDLDALDALRTLLLEILFNRPHTHIQVTPKSAFGQKR